MIDNNIIQSLGAGSGIDTRNLVSQLVEIEKAAPQQRITEKKELAEDQISDYGKLQAAMSTLKDAAEVMMSEEGVFSKDVTFTESDQLIPVEVDENAVNGTYSLQVQQVAASHSLSTSAVFSDPTDAVGLGTVTISFGTWADNSYNSFTQDTATDQVAITIDNSNNTLKGLRDAINDAEAGVSASIVEVGTDQYVLQLTADSGASNQLAIDVAEDGGTNYTDSDGLSRFAFGDIDGTNANRNQMQGDQLGADAQLKLNGLSVSRSTNQIDDLVPGLTFNVLEAPPNDDMGDPTEGDIITITVSDFKDLAEQTVRDFVTAYNNFLTEIDPLFGKITEEVDGEEVSVDGSLARDSLGKSVISQIRTLIASEIPGLSDGSFTALTNIGIRTELDGTLSVDDDDMATAFEDNFEDVKKLLAPYTDSSTGFIDVYSYGDQTIAGNYDVTITQAPEQGILNLYEKAGSVLPGQEAALEAGTYDTTGKTFSFDISINGTDASQTISLSIPDGTYTGGQIASFIQSAINADTTLQENSASVTASFEEVDGAGGYGFVLTSTKYGTASTITVSNASNDASTDLGFGDYSGDAGKDVKGSVNGEAVDGLGQVLRPALGNDAEGLNLIVSSSVTLAETFTVDFSRGFSGGFSQLIDQFLESNGLFDQREANLQTQIDGYDDDQKDLDRRMDSYNERLLQQFIAMENILNGLSNSGGFLDNLINTLPFTASNE